MIHVSGKDAERDFEDDWSRWLGEGEWSRVLSQDMFEAYQEVRHEILENNHH